MPDNQSKSGSLLNWIGGIAATVIAGVVLFYATRQPPPNPQVGLDGFVVDLLSHKFIPNAMVTVNLGPKLATQNTDTQGRYSFILDGTSSQSQNQTVAVDLLVGSDVHYSTTLNVHSGENFLEIRVPPTPHAYMLQLPQGVIPPHPAAPPPAHSSPRPTIVLQAPLNYIKRPDAVPLNLGRRP